jgi:chemotaxis signal transduction protein
MPEITPSAEDRAGSKVLLFWQGGECCAIPADLVVKVVPSQPLTLLPFLPKPVLGVVAISGKVVPVLDLHLMLDLPSGDQMSGELVLVAMGAETFGLRVDHVLRITAHLDQWLDTPVRLIDVGDLFERHLRERTTALAALVSLDVTRLHAVPGESAAQDQATVLGVRGAALAVETARSYEFLPLDLVVELSETLPVASVPDPSPVFAGAAFFRDTLLPVICLDSLLGRPLAPAEARGSFIVVDADGRRCALAVKQMIGLVPDAEPESVIDIRRLLESLLPQTEPGGRAAMVPAAPAPTTQGPAPETRYLMVELTGQMCAFALPSVAHIHAECRVVQMPAATHSAAVGVTAIGGRVLPVLDLAAALGLATGSAPQHFIELKSQQTGPFMVAIDRIVGIAAIGQDALIPPLDGGAVNAVARLGANLVWVLDAASIVEQSGWRCDAA